MYNKLAQKYKKEVKPILTLTIVDYQIIIVK